MIESNTVKELEKNSNSKRNIKKQDFNRLHPNTNWQSLPEMWAWISRTFHNHIAIEDPHQKNCPQLTFAQLYNLISNFAAGLQNLGLKQGDKVSLFSENSSRWLIADQGIIMAGCINAVRGSQAPAEELAYILKHSESSALIIENQEILNKLLPFLSDINLKFIVQLWDNDPEYNKNIQIPVYTFNEILNLAEATVFEPVFIKKNDIATLIYTSGTTGKPKGAALTHGNILHQIKNLKNFIHLKPADTLLSILPVWHAYERSCEYYIFSRGCKLIYTNLRSFKKDLSIYNPQLLLLVPRILESLHEAINQEFKKKSKSKQSFISFFLNASKHYIKARRTLQGLNIKNFTPSLIDLAKAEITSSILHPVHRIADKIVYSKIRQALGGRIENIICGGGTLAGHIEDFYEIADLNVLVGYGLTETSPVLTVRNCAKNLRGSVGIPITHTQIRIVNPETFQPLPNGQKGLVMAKGPQIMKGYYHDSKATNNVINSDSWFNTGDLGWMTDNNDLILTGRLKDLIVLSNGEKVEPQPIEEACLQSKFIKQIIVVGQDQHSLGAIVVPDFENLKELTGNISFDLSDLNSRDITELFRKEINQQLIKRFNYRQYELISNLRIISEPFTIDNGFLTQTMKVKRTAVLEYYSYTINEIFKKV